MKERYSLVERILAFALVCLMLLGSIPTSVFAAPAEEIEHEDPVPQPIMTSTLSKDLLAEQEVVFSVDLSNKELLAGQNVTGEITFVGENQPTVFYEGEQGWNEVSGNEFAPAHIAKEKYNFKVKFPAGSKDELQYQMSVQLKTTDDPIRVISSIQDTVTVHKGCKISVSVENGDGEIQINGQSVRELTVSQFPATISITPAERHELISFSAGDADQSALQKQGNSFIFQVSSFAEKDIKVSFEHRSKLPGCWFENEYQEFVYTQKLKVAVPKLIGLDSTGDFSYSIQTADGQNADDIADFEGGILIIKQAGSLVVTAEKKQNDNSTIKATYHLEIKKAERKGLKLEGVPSEIVFDSKSPKYYYMVTGNVPPSGVTYAIVSQEAADPRQGDVANISAENGELTILQAGTVEVVATIAEDTQYESATVSHKLTIQKGTIEGEDFFFSDKLVTITYAPKKTYQQTPRATIPDGTITYAIKEETADGQPEAVANINAQTGELEIIRSGTVVIEATRQEDGQYKAVTAEYTLIINKAQQNGLKLEGVPEEIVFDGKNPKYNYTIPDNKSFGKVTYAIVSQEAADPRQGDVANISAENGELTILQAGTVEVVATIAEDARYESATVSHKLTIQKGTIEGEDFFFSDKLVTITYAPKKTYQQTPQTTIPDGTITYAIKEETADGQPEDVANIDAQTGMLKINRSGTVVIEATRQEDGQYKAATAEYTLIINKADQPISFDKQHVTQYYGERFVENKVHEEASHHGNASLRYGIDGENKIQAQIDSETGAITFQDSGTKVGEIKIKVSRASDEKYNACEAFYTLTVSYLEDVPAPRLEGLRHQDSEWYIGQVRIIAPDGYAISYSNKLDAQSWKPYVLYEKQGDNSVEYYLRNKETGAISDVQVIGSLKLDMERPEIHKITYNEEPVWETIEDQLFGFSKGDIEIGIDASDAVSQIVKWEYSKDGGATYEELPADHKITIKAPFRNKVLFRVWDAAGLCSEDGSKGTVVVDNESPKATIAYTNDYVDMVEGVENTHVDTAGPNTRFVYKSQICAVLKIKEDNFFPKDVQIRVLRNGEAYTGFKEEAWTEAAGESGTYSKAIYLQEDGDYVIMATYEDRSMHGMEWTSEEYVGKSGVKTYTSNILTVVRSAPYITLEYLNKNEVNNGIYTGEQKVKVLVQDRNFRPEGIAFKATGKDASGVDVKFDCPAINTWKGWTPTQKGWIKEVPFTVDANYSLSINYTDIAGRTAKPAAASFTVDNHSPEKAEVSYSQSLLDKVMEDITFGYYKQDATVTLTATDRTAGIGCFEVDVSSSDPEDATDVKLPENLVIGADGKISGDQGCIQDIQVHSQNGTTTATFKVPAQFRGQVSFVPRDMAGWSLEPITDNKIIVVDRIAPTRSITYSPSRIVDSSMKNVDKFDEGDDVVLYYNKDAVVTLKVKETNFYKEDVMIKVNGKVVEPPAWEKNTENEWESAITLKDAGDYVVTMDYKDRSQNEMVSYSSPRIVVDKTAPIVNVSYSNTAVKNSRNGRAYYDSKQIATVTIQEHNFRAEDVVLGVSAKNVIGEDVMALNADGTVASYAQQGSDRANWTPFESGTWRREDDTYELNLVFDTDANYTLDVYYEDLAANRAADYTEDHFTVDQTAPTDLTISYSSSILDQILESVTFGFYNGPVTVTVTAQDDTTNIEHFAYSYVNAEGVSSVNEQLLDAAIQSADITYDGNKATAVFDIPGAALTADKQFNGTVQFTAYDMAQNNRALADNQQIVVDNISPTATITFNSPVKEVNGVSYYSGNITGTIVINEANFYSGDVQVNVTRGGEAVPVNVVWSDNSADSHTGTFVLSQEGDYRVSVQYQDKSGNHMANYTSAQLTLDTTKPSINVSHVKANSANKDQVYGFTITLDDVNLDPAAMKPVLTAVIRDKNGLFVTQEIPLDEPTAVSQGKTYRYTVDNLPLDALYTLTCSAKDMSDNSVTETLLDDGKTYKDVHFSINRNGSVFGFGNSYTENLVNQYYTYSVDQNVEIVEINVDPIEHYSVTLNGKKLQEGVHFTTNQSTETGKWSKRTYSIHKEMFEDEGEYNITISSTDKTNTVAYSDVKDLKIAFVVDQTKPVVIISGMESNGRYQTDEQVVTLIPSDEGGRLNSLSVLAFESNGKPKTNQAGEDISVRFDMKGEQLLKYLEENNGVVIFTIPEGLQNSVQIICNDYAVNAEGKTNEYNEVFTDVTVSQNRMIMFYANKPLFYGTIGGLLLVVLMVIIGIVYLKRAKSSSKTKAAVK